jgi:DNA (cytosine-5)-methyltransferase 1
VKNWPTPKAQCANSPGVHGEGGKDLQTEAANWATPTARDWKDGTCGPETWGKKGENSLLSRQDVMKCSNGRSSSNGTPNSPRESLNPAFVEWLMGLPPEWTVCEPAETRWFLWWLRKHLSLLEGD